LRRGEEIHETRKSSENTKALISINSTLLKMINNVNPYSYIDMRELRKKFQAICRDKKSFSPTDQEMSDEIKDLLEKAKETHPEMFSKDDFVKTGAYESIKESFSQVPPETTWLQPSGSFFVNTPDMSKDLLSSFRANHQPLMNPVGCVNETQETTLDPPSIFTNPNLSKDLMSSYIARKRKSQPSDSTSKKVKKTAPKAKKVKSPETDSESPSLMDQNMRENDLPPVAIEDAHREILSGDKLMAKLELYQMWADELFAALEH